MAAILCKGTETSRADTLRKDKAEASGIKRAIA